MNPLDEIYKLPHPPQLDPWADAEPIDDPPAKSIRRQAYRPFPTDAFPPAIARFIGEASAALGCDPAYVGVPLLPALASAIGNTRRIRLKGSWSEPAVVWAAIVGESGTVKSPALELATRPIWARQRKILSDHAAARADYESDRKAWKATKKDDRGDEPKPPPAMEHPLCSDITVEALADRLLATPRGTLIALDELSGWFGSFNQYKPGGGDVAHWLAMHGARALKVDRKTGNKTTIYVPHAAVCIAGTIQPETLRRVLLPEHFENGLAARLLVSMPATTPKRWTDHEIDDATDRAVGDVFRALYAMQQVPGVDGERGPMIIDLSDDARADFAAFVDETGQAIDGMSGPSRAAWSKLEGYAARFALIRHCCRQAAGEPIADYIDADDIAAGIGLARWFGGETDRVYGRMSESDEHRERRELLELIRRLGGRVTARQLKEHCRRFASSEDAELALNALADEAMGAWETIRQAGRGRPMTVFVLAESNDLVPVPPFRVPVNRYSSGNSYLPVPGTLPEGKKSGDER